MVAQREEEVIVQPGDFLSEKSSPSQTTGMNRMKTQSKQESNGNVAPPSSQVFYAWDKSRLRRTGRSCRFPDEYIPVAAVACDDLEEVFWMMNYSSDFFDPLMNGPIVLNTRCLSVGDVVMRPDGSTWICGPRGWEPISHGEEYQFDVIVDPDESVNRFMTDFSDI